MLSWLPDINPFLDSSFPLWFPQFCNFQEGTFATRRWHGSGQDHPGHLHCCLLPAGMALAGGHSFFCEIYMGRGTVSLATCPGSVKRLRDGQPVLCFAKVKLLNVLRQRNEKIYWFRNLMVGDCLVLTVWYMPNFFFFGWFSICNPADLLGKGQLEKVCPLTLC